MGSKNSKDTFFNIIKFANNPKVWEDKKLIMSDLLSKDFKRREFVEKHLTENFKNLIPDKTLLDSLKNIIGYSLLNSFQSPNFKFMLRFDFTKREIFDKNVYEFKIELKDIETKCKVVNKRELKKIFIELLNRISYEIGYTQGMIDRIDLDIKILCNEKDSLVIAESIQDIQKIFFDFVCKVVTENKYLYNYLFPFLKYCLENQIVRTQNEFFQFVADLVSNNIDVKAIKKTFFLHKKNNKISKLW